LVGTTILVDLRILGFGARRHTVSELAARLAASARTGLAIMLVTGPLLFGSDAARYSSNPAFRVKMALLFLALACHFTIHRRYSKRAAIVSMILWTSVVIGGRAIADFDV
jgi:hypothetical protein